MHATLKYLYSLERFGIKLGLDIITQLLQLVGNPHTAFKSVQITGTCGKGSTAAFLATILQRAGYTVGLYTSPHLITFNERIQINGVPISDEDIISLTECIKNETQGIQATFFEFTTAMAFLHFAQQKVDIAIIEAGMGAKLDATNVLTPLVSVITNVSVDHAEYLGRTIRDIAIDKAAAIKPQTPMVTTEQDKTILALFRERCAAQGSSLYRAAPTSLPLSLQGEHQRFNAGIAVKTAELLNERGFPVSDAAIAEGLATTHWPGRLEILSDDPLIMADGAHNVASMQALHRFLREFPQGHTLLLGIARDKDIPGMVKQIAPLFQKIIVTQGNYKPAPTMIIAAEARKYTGDVLEIPSPAAALAYALHDRQPIIITGSLYLVGDILANRNLFKEAPVL